eukprot:TRINITY_DN3748_c0_g1_i1.p1 TRINITY_DN3748_c0_g1~~TRINITY_DN3748_c0_g1_i1.p1  ORF type:complete len:183 (-),score=37.83 TRINITY_DN3748_c0_g1_i1:231-779(-)
MDRHQACLKTIKDALSSDERIKTLVRAVELARCRLPEGFFQCRPCDSVPAGTGAYFDSSERELVVCEDRLGEPRATRHAVAHELVHAFDWCRADVNLADCSHVACTEIRAANLAGDCLWLRELMRGNGLHLRKQHQACVRRRAELSVAQISDCAAPGQAKAAVDKAWSSCFPDLNPFDRIPV